MRSILIVLLLLAACGPQSAPDAGVGRVAQVSCTDATSDMAQWQCQQYAARQNIDGYCLTVPGGDLGIWQCKQFYTRQLAGSLVPKATLPTATSRATSLARTIYTSRLGGRDAIFLNGPINRGDDQEFIRVAASLENPLIVLTGPGGNVAAALNIGRFLRLRAWNTVVPGGHSCMSACGLIWLAGGTRYMASSSKVGFHASFRVDDGRAVESGVGNALVGAYLNSLGLSERAIVYFTKSAPNDMQILSADDARLLDIPVAASEAVFGVVQP
jgi:hypothetical protein